MSRIAFRNFTGGEVTPSLASRYDLKKAGTFLQCCRNFVPNIHGDIERRPGTVFVADLGAESVILPFQFNTEPANNYVLIFQEKQILVASATGMESGTEMANPYSLSEVYELSYAQVGDVVYLAHASHPLHKLYRSGSVGNYKWTIEEVALNQSLDPPDGLEATWHRGTKSTSDSSEYTDNETYDLCYKVSSVDEDGIESVASDEAKVTARYPTDWVNGDYVELSWESVAGAKEYNIYRDSAGYFGLIGIVDCETSAGGTLDGVVIGQNTYETYGNYYLDVRHTVVTGGDENGVPSQNTTTMEVKSNSSYKAFMIPDGLLVFTTYAETNTTWQNYGTSENPVWGSTTTSESREFWSVVDAAGPGDVSSYTEASLGSDPDYPHGTAGDYTVKPHYTTSGTVTFKDENFEADTTMTPKEDWNPFEDGNNPAVVCFHQQRMVLASTPSDPATFYMSRTGDFESFRKSRPLQDDDPVEYMIASGSIDEIKWITSFGDLLVGTCGAEYDVSCSGAAITPSDVTIASQSFWGSAGLKPLVIGNSVLHCQRAGSHVRDLVYSWEQDGYTGNDLSVLAPQLVEGYRLQQWTYQQTPGSNVWVVRDDGILLCLTYMQEQQVYGWSRHVTDGQVMSVATVCGDNEDVVMLVVKRVINGEVRCYLERMAARFKDSDAIEDAWYVDCGVKQTFPERVTEVSGLSHLEGKEVVVLADGAPEEGHVVRDGAIHLNFPAEKVLVGLNFKSVLVPLPIESDTDNGTTVSKRRTYGQCVVRLYRSVGGKFYGTTEGDIYDPDAWSEKPLYEIPYIPENFGEAVQPYSGDRDFTLGPVSGADPDSSIIIVQDRPMPFRLVALLADVDFPQQ